MTGYYTFQTALDNVLKRAKLDIEQINVVRLRIAYHNLYREQIKKDVLNTNDNKILEIATAEKLLTNLINSGNYGLQTQAISDYQRTIQRYQREIDDLKKMMIEHEEIITEQRKIITEYQATMDQQQSTIDMHKATVVEHQSTIAQQYQTIDQYQHMIDELRDIISEHEKIIGQHEATIVEHQDTIVKYEETIGENEAIIAEQARSIDEQQKLIVLGDNDRDALQEQYGLLKQENESMKVENDVLMKKSISMDNCMKTIQEAMNGID
ncbi:unnamed protein product [Didymodactylos carnosus]|uniref:Uncharacterized protein n=1 Tax=Didymodactylos carnosus TaxID=1234261 RepID=A0A8S2DP32_9BILA|nr:unnamed protein product [Didymodactylos carnosus]CAF3734154.1 unnamed protein product [Didymodactylos carnosus]